MDDFPMYEDMYDIDEYDIYDDMEWEEPEVYVEATISLTELKDNCIIPSLSTTVEPLVRLLLSCFVFKFTNSFGEFPASITHMTSVVTGLYAVHLFANEKLGYVLLLGVVAYTVLFTVHKTIRRQYGAYCAIVTILFLVICESVVVESKEWHAIRGIQMILAMKVISLGFDLDHEIVSFPHPLEYSGYCFCVGTVIFGPWVSFSDYQRLLQKTKLSLLWLANMTINVAVCFGFLLLSTCFSHWLIPNSWNKWSLAYRDALSFRSSHYFVSFISEVTVVSVGLGSASSSFWETTVTKPQHIEIPRSLTEVVIYWNVPMHTWLKKYVFRTVRPLNKFAAILSTYATSSLLHGLNFQLAAVLLSLGLYTFIEYVLREKLANIFDACILARRCRPDCFHQFKQSHPAVIAANVGFGLLTVFHLAYLGVMFGSSTNQEDQGYSMYHTLSKWSELNFASHWLSLATFIFYWLI